MSAQYHYSTAAQRRQARVRSQVRGTSVRPRVAIFRSNEHLNFQVIDDEKKQNLFSVGSVALMREVKTEKKDAALTKTQRGEAAAQKLIEQLKAKKIKAVVIDRGAYKYHGRVKAAVEALRQAGIEV